MKLLLSFILIIATLPSVAQVNISIKWLQHTPLASSDTVYYNANRKLTWPDFKGKPVLQSDATAITSSGFGYLATMQSRDGKTDIAITVYCYFGKQSSWVRVGGQSDYALTHEQHHFDVTYIVTNLFIKKLKAAKFTRNNYGNLTEKIYNESCRELEKMQNDYDGKTRNGRLKNVQVEWNTKIEKQLNLLPTQ